MNAYGPSAAFGAAASAPAQIAAARNVNACRMPHLKSFHQRSNLIDRILDLVSDEHLPEHLSAGGLIAVHTRRALPIIFHERVLANLTLVHEEHLRSVVEARMRV